MERLPTLVGCCCTCFQIKLLRFENYGRWASRTSLPRICFEPLISVFEASLYDGILWSTYSRLLNIINFRYRRVSSFIHATWAGRSGRIVHIICNSHQPTDLLSSTPVQTSPLITVCFVIFVYEAPSCFHL
jgi:hypothetical protein